MTYFEKFRRHKLLWNDKSGEIFYPPEFLPLKIVNLFVVIFIIVPIIIIIIIIIVVVIINIIIITAKSLKNTF